MSPLTGIVVAFGLLFVAQVVMVRLLLHHKHAAHDAGHGHGHGDGHAELSGRAGVDRGRQAAASVWEEDPMPGVHMVYMYVNGSDPGVAIPRAKFGGSATGEEVSCVCRLTDAVRVHNPRRCLRPRPRHQILSVSVHLRLVHACAIRDVMRLLC
jgi:hypothetical protein